MRAAVRERIEANGMVLEDLEALERVTERVSSLTVFGGLEHVMKDLVRLGGTDRQARRA